METLAPEKEKVLSYVSEENLVKLAKNVISIPSPTEGETDMAIFLEKYMRDNGLETEMIEVESGRFQPIGRIKGTGGRLFVDFQWPHGYRCIMDGNTRPLCPKN